MMSFIVIITSLIAFIILISMVEKILIFIEKVDISVFLISSYGTPLAQRDHCTGLSSGKMVQITALTLLIGSRCIPIGAHSPTH